MPAAQTGRAGNPIQVLRHFDSQPGPDSPAEEARKALLACVAGWLTEAPASGLSGTDLAEAYVPLRAGLERLCANSPADGLAQRSLRSVKSFDAGLSTRGGSQYVGYQIWRREVTTEMEGYIGGCAEAFARSQDKDKSALQQEVLQELCACNPETAVELYAAQLSWDMTWGNGRPPVLGSEPERYPAIGVRWDMTDAPASERMEYRKVWARGMQAGAMDVLADGLSNVRMPSGAQLWERFAGLYPAPEPVMGTLWSVGCEVQRSAAQYR